MKKRILFIINPISGVQTKAGLPELIPQFFSEQEFIVVTEYTQYAGHAHLIAQKAAHLGYDAVIAVGGDGTINEVGSALVGTETALGIIAMGSGNGLARHLKLPLKPKQALRVISGFNTAKIDTGLINGKPFIGIAGLGFDAYIGKKFSRHGKRGFFTYLKLVLKEYLSFRERTLILKRKGNKETVKAMMVTVANSSQFGNNAVIAPDAVLDDGQLRLCIVRKFPLYKAPWIAYLMVTRQIHRSAYLNIYPVKKVTIKQSKKLAHLDGEPLKIGKKVKIKVLPASLKILVQAG
ncbi:MAG: YegS/Rv2252/BmrU family lipid kinase [Bacteroidota bacterium]